MTRTGVASTMILVRDIGGGYLYSLRVNLPPGAVVSVAGHRVRIPAGETRAIATPDGGYELVDWDRDTPKRSFWRRILPW